MCSLASTTCVVDYEAALWEGALTGEKGKVVANKECLESCKERKDCVLTDTICINTCKNWCEADCVNEDGKILNSWKEDMEDMCISLGDCGTSFNYIREKGYYDDVNDFIVTGGEEDEEE